MRTATGDTGHSVDRLSTAGYTRPSLSHRPTEHAEHIFGTAGLVAHTGRTTPTAPAPKGAIANHRLSRSPPAHNPPGSPGRDRSGKFAVFEAARVAFEREDHGVADQAVNHRCGGDLLTEVSRQALKALARVGHGNDRRRVSPPSWAAA